MKAKDDLYNEFFQASSTNVLSPYKTTTNQPENFSIDPK